MPRAVTAISDGEAKTKRITEMAALMVSSCWTDARATYLHVSCYVMKITFVFISDGQVLYYLQVETCPQDTLQWHTWGLKDVPGSSFPLLPSHSSSTISQPLLTYPVITFYLYTHTHTRLAKWETSDTHLFSIGCIRRGSGCHCQQLDGSCGITENIWHLLSHGFLHPGFQILKNIVYKWKFPGISKKHSCYCPPFPDKIIHSVFINFINCEYQLCTKQ